MSLNPESPTILCIEDEANIADVIKASLLYGGFHVMVAATAAEGLDMARTFRPDLILLDLILPDINGYSFFDLLQESELTDIPVVIVSGCVSTEAQALGRRLGAVDYITKPFDIKDLIARVRKAVRGSKAERKPARGRSSKAAQQPVVTAVKVESTKPAKASKSRVKSPEENSVSSSKRR